MARVESRDWVEDPSRRTRGRRRTCDSAVDLDPYGARSMHSTMRSCTSATSIIRGSCRCRTDEQRKAIEEVLADRQEGNRCRPHRGGRDPRPGSPCSPRSANSGAGAPTSSPRQIVAGITKEQVAAYRAQVAKGGTDIIERVVTALGDGRVSITNPAHVQALAQRHGHSGTRRGSSASSATGSADGMHPQPESPASSGGYFDGTEHNAVTAARTEAQKTPDRRPGLRPT